MDRRAGEDPTIRPLAMGLRELACCVVKVDGRRDSVPTDDCVFVTGGHQRRGGRRRRGRNRPKRENRRWCDRHAAELSLSPGPPSLAGQSEVKQMARRSCGPGCAPVAAHRRRAGGPACRRRPVANRDTSLALSVHAGGNDQRGAGVAILAQVRAAQAALTNPTLAESRRREERRMDTLESIAKAQDPITVRRVTGSRMSATGCW